MYHPTISIIIPVYNAEQYLNRCIDSILSQSYQFKELILIDDGSQDKSGDICDSYAMNDDRIRVFHNSNMGVSATRNFGLDKATGDYVSFLDSDDWIEPDYYRDFFGNDDFMYDIYFQNYICHKEDGTTEIRPLNSFSVQNGDIGEAILYLKKEVKFGWAWIKLFKHSIISQYAIRFDESITLREDELFALQYCRHVNSLCIRSDANYHYYIYGNSLTRRFRDPIEYIRISKLLMQESLYFSEVPKMQEYESSYYLRNLYTAVLGLYVNGVLNGYVVQKRLFVIREFLQYYYAHKNIDIPYRTKKARFLYLLLWKSHSPRFIDFVFQKWFSTFYRN